MEKEKEVTKEYWQWIKGDDSGNVVTIKNTDDKWIHFNEGGRLAKDLKDEFIQLLDEDIAGEFVNKPVNNDSLFKVSTEPTPIAKASPIRLLLDKQKKLDQIPLQLFFEVDAPRLDIMSVLENSFDSKELGNEVEKFIEDQINVEEIVSTLKDSIKILIKERYKQS